MNCAEIRETMPDLAVGSVEPSTEVLQHMETCAPCTAQLEEFRKTMALLDEWQVPEPSPYFDTRLQARLREEKAAESARASRWFAWFPRPALAAAATVLVAAGIGFFSMQQKPVVTNNPVAINVQRGTAVADLQTLDSDNDLYADFDVLDEMDTQRDQPTSQ
jgi:anti-sigma factor RsiW